jgi:hypothetical protein
MLWRLGCFLCGLPLGALGALALRSELELGGLALGAVAGGGLWVALASLGARRAGNVGRGAQLASGASLALAAAPALVCALLGLAPGPRGSLLLALPVAALGLAHGARARGPARRAAARLAAATLVLLAASAAWLGIAAALASLSAPLDPMSEARAAAVYDLDARVALAPRPACRPRARRVTALLGFGAHPRLDAAGAYLWFDARTPEGRVQVHRLERASRAVVCWTCGEPGNNRWPGPDPLGRHVVFDSDRFASLLEPLETELFVAGASGEAPAFPAHRLTFRPGPDDHALLSEAGVVVWSRGEGGSYDVVSASLRAGHGSLRLGEPGRLARGGLRWALPLAWSRDARHLVVARGQPWRPLELALLDPATGAERELAPRAPAAPAAAFAADGGWLALAGTEPDGIGARLPGGTGFLLGRLGRRGGAGGGGSEVFVGEPLGPAEPVELGALGRFGSPTGIALEPDGRAFVLGQRRLGPGGNVEERLVSVELDCD